MKYLIFGVNGMAGHIIACYLKEQGHEITGFAKSESKICKTITGDALNREAVKKAVEDTDFDLCINCIGILNRAVDNCLSDGIYLNSVLPHYLADTVNNKGKKLIHISSDCVFEGTRGGYQEQDIPDAISYYGRSKALGEVIDNNNITIRTSIVGPELKENGVGLFHWFMSQKKEAIGYTKVIWSGVTTLQLAKSINQLSTTNISGMYNLVNNATICKHDLLILFNEYCRKNKIIINAGSAIVNDRSLVNTREKEIPSIPSYEQMVEEMAEWISCHPDLYQQYSEC